eukprot:TRINITY_DN14613_c0_g1_i4.p1 TRINITY_DN14613_c0_g1~~TRINITY_DN14613_c0_g1_i4.p1  ORF type:complete len:233 (+),score=89.42 TRINITY_DN14613_c0_g1_i4:454-1152(+)
MPKKMGVNSKSEEARNRKAAAAAEVKVKEEKQKEEQYWQGAEGPKSKAAKKKEEEAMKRAEQAAKRAEAKALAEKEEKEMEKYGKKPAQKVNQVAGLVPKVTAADLAKQREEEHKETEAKAEAVKAKEKRMTAEKDYDNMVLQANTNRIESLIDARSVDEALSQMTVGDDVAADRHPERRLKAAFKLFEDAELPRLKVERPGLTLTQYKDLLWKMWKKSPANPMNQPQGQSS